MDDLNRKLNIYKKRKRFLGILTTVLGVLCPVFLFLSIKRDVLAFKIALAACVAVALILYFTVYRRAEKKLSAFYHENIFNGWLEECRFIDGIAYEPENRSMRDILRGNRAICHLDSVSYSVSGSYGGSRMLLSNVELGEETGDAETSSYQSYFDGAAAYVELGRDFGCDMLLASGLKRDKVYDCIYPVLPAERLPDVQLGGQSLRKCFRVCANDAETAIARLESFLADAAIRLRVESETGVLILIQRDKLILMVDDPLFGWHEKLDVDAEKNRITENLRRITDFVDALR